MKRLIALIVIMGAILISTSCTTAYYIADGYYYTEGVVITDDGNMWGYHTDLVAYDGMPISIRFSDNNTPHDIYDDIILGVEYKGE